MLGYSTLILQILAICYATRAGTVPVAERNLKNILLFVSDDLRPEIGVYTDEEDAYYKSIKTPNIDGLAEESLVFKRAYTQVSVCAPSRASFLTGRRPDTTQVLDNQLVYWRDMGGNFTTMPQYFKENGYVTYASGKVFHQGYDDDNQYSWTEPNYRPNANIAYWYQDALSWEIISSEDNMTDILPPPDTAIRNNAIERLQQIVNESLADDPDPFFLAVGFQKPHLPFMAPEEFYDLYPEEEIYLPQLKYSPLYLPEVAWSNWSDLMLWRDMDPYDSSFNNTLPDNETLALRRAYYACVSYMDSLVGDVLQELADLGLEDNTIVVFMSDHGFHLGEHAEWGKQTNFELDNRVPLMIKIPGITEGDQQSDALVELVDVFPTLVELAGLPKLDLCPEDSVDIDVCHEGHSLVELINDGLPAEEWKSASFSQFYRNRNGFEAMGYSIHVPEYRYVKWVSYWNRTLDWDDVIAEELFDLVNDPNESVNVESFDEYVLVKEEMESRLLDGWRNALPVA